MRSVILAICASLILGTMALAAAQQTEQRHIEGTIKNYEDHKPVSGLELSVFSKSGKLATTKTDANGHFQFDSLPAQPPGYGYIVKFKAYGSTMDWGIRPEDGNDLLLLRDPSFHYVQAGEQAPELNIKEWVNSGALDRSSLKGKVVLLDFWFVECMPCQQELPRLEMLSKKYAGKLVVIGVHYDEKIDRAKLAGFAKSHDLTYPLCIDRGGSSGLFVDKFVTRGAPTLAVIDQNWKVVQINGTPEQADEEIAELLAGK